MTFWKALAIALAATTLPFVLAATLSPIVWLPWLVAGVVFVFMLRELWQGR